ncbi:hypothetical protein M440DRAFT_1438353 [Trichoderma longibrachiatum ATCC 18648]|uniref:Uncharacterized protein n=1 Tax=Trichoderma longibrachiatum ATCC 18648 TaxID=983965 RepID=A0A2T4C8T4_TRILO|nr:hypothetical protein M440DRAFT_1438353 [Trichoderma longibrachiatum ATCC 18648]
MKNAARSRETACMTGHPPTPSRPLCARHGVLVAPRRSQRLFDTETDKHHEADIHLRGTLADRSGTRRPFRCAWFNWKPYLAFLDFWTTKEPERLHPAFSPGSSPQSPSSKVSLLRRFCAYFQPSPLRFAYIMKSAMVDAILRGDLDPSVCCSYGQCKGDVVVSVGY